MHFIKPQTKLNHFYCTYCVHIKQWTWLALLLLYHHLLQDDITSSYIELLARKIEFKVQTVSKPFEV